MHRAAKHGNDKTIRIMRKKHLLRISRLPLTSYDRIIDSNELFDDAISAKSRIHDNENNADDSGDYGNERETIDAVILRFIRHIYDFPRHFSFPRSCRFHLQDHRPRRRRIVLLLCRTSPKPTTSRKHIAAVKKLNVRDPPALSKTGFLQTVPARRRR